MPESEIESEVDTAENILEAVVVASPVAGVASLFFIPLSFPMDLVVGMISVLSAAVVDTVYGVILKVPNNVGHIYYIEHYHWGLVLLALSKFFTPLFGAGAYLLFSDVFHLYPYSWGEEKHHNFFGSTLVGVALFVVNLWIYLSPSF